MNDALLHSEQDFITLIDRYFPNDRLSLGRGDDCAVFSCPDSLCVTTDLFVEDVHFRRSYFSPQDIGHKSLAVNLSDLASMGAVPLGFSLALVAPRGVPVSFWEGFFQGMAGLAGKYDIALTGGDLSDGDKISVGITAWGAPAGKVLKRCQTRVGDTLFVIGRIGMARTGLCVLEQGDAPGGFVECLGHHLRPDPLVDHGRILSRLPGVRGAMDVSDGLDQDLPRFLVPGQGADLFIGPDLIHDGVKRFCTNNGLNPARFCLKGGEDYALLAAIEPGFWNVLVQSLPDAWKLGTVVAGKYSLNGQEVLLQGFDHFSQEQQPRGDTL
ncbi:thiamine-phosphate kinase [Desulfoplanes sp.]